MRITFKDQDAVEQALEDEMAEVAEEHREYVRSELKKKLKNFIKFAESVTIDFDLTTCTATVVRRLSSRLTTKNGLVYQDGEPLGCSGADAEARKHGFAYAEQLVAALKKEE